MNLEQKDPRCQTSYFTSFDHQWVEYDAQIEKWEVQNFDDDMDKAMRKPNTPGYYRANND